MNFIRNAFVKELHKKLSAPIKNLWCFGFSLWLLSVAHALEFGTMGNMSASMGGAGVALKNSEFGLYYNPALLSATPKIRIDYTAGITLRERNIIELSNVDFANMQDTATRLGETFKGGGDANGVMKVLGEALDSVLNNSTGATGAGGAGTTQGVQEKLTSYINSKNGSNDYGDLISAFKTKLTSNSDFNQVQKDLLTSVISGIDFDTLGVGGNTSASASATTAQKSFSVTIAKGSDKGLDKSMSDIEMVKTSLQDNHINFNAQGGVVLQLGSKFANYRTGTVAAGVFGSMYSSISLKANPNKLGLIIKSESSNGGTSGGSNTPQYYELVIGDSDYTYKLSSESSYTSSSLIASLGSSTSDADAHKITISSLMLTEIPIGYARTLYTPWGNLNVGASLKLLNTLSKQKQIVIKSDTDMAKEMSNLTQDFKNLTQDKAFGVDVGALYEVDMPNFRNLTIGLVAKNVNSPTFNSTLGGLTIKPQVRAGVAYYREDGFNVAFDADLTQNDIIAFTTKAQKSQMIGGGFGFLKNTYQARFGAMLDVAQDNGLFLTGGVSVLGFLDLAMQIGTKVSQLQGYYVPQYFSFRLGGGFSF